MVGIPDVELGENNGPLEKFKGCGKDWEGVTIINCDIIQSMIVYAEA